METSQLSCELLSEQTNTILQRYCIAFNAESSSVIENWYETEWNV